MNVNDLIKVLNDFGLPSWAIASVVCLLATIYILAQIKSFRSSAPSVALPQKSNEELLSSDQQTFRRDLLERVTNLERQCDEDTQIRMELQRELTECKLLHEETKRDMQEINEKLEECHKSRDDERARYLELHGHVIKLIDMMRDFGSEFLSSMVKDLPQLPGLLDMEHLLNEVDKKLQKKS